MFTYNLGTGQGRSVLEVIATYEQQSRQPVPFEIVERRAGDVAANWADAALAESELGWKATRSLEEMCADSWRWQTRAG